jgi:hypothetical protein
MTATPTTTGASALRAELARARAERDRALAALRVVHDLLAGLPGTWEVGADDIAWLPHARSYLQGAVARGEVDAADLACLEACFARRYLYAFHRLNPGFGGLLWQYRSIAEADVAAAQARELELALGPQLAAALLDGQGGEAT